MKISLCIPQYNRIKFLLFSLSEIARQDYPDIEIVISDDCSSDETQSEIQNLIPVYKYPIIYHRHEVNLGYDRNLRRSLELATGDYVIILGNDDTINPEYDLHRLVRFLKENEYPEVGFTNFIDAGTGEMEERASMTGIIGSGPELAFTNYSRFSFVGGIIYKRSTYNKYNSDKFDGSVYTQIYHSCLIVASGGILFSIAEPVVIKDVLPLEQNRASYVDKVNRSWKKFKAVNGGLHAVIRVAVTSFEDAGVLNQNMTYGIIRKIYASTFPYWVITYRKDKALPEAVGLVVGMRPAKVREFNRLSLINKLKINLLYAFTSFSSLVIPVFVFDLLKTRLWKMANRV